MRALLDWYCNLAGKESGVEKVDDRGWREIAGAAAFNQFTLVYKPGGFECQ